jgi:peptidoglycan/LPS O-acetylase OafA/YrhL
MPDKSRRYLPSLDGTRGIFAFVILVGHYGYARMGWIALEYFFVLSGYLITSILLGGKNRSFGPDANTSHGLRSTSD